MSTGDGRGWIVWSDEEPVGAGETRAAAVEHARSRGFKGGFVKLHNGWEARTVRRVLDHGADGLTDEDAQRAVNELQTLADQGSGDAAEFLRSFTAGTVH